MKAFAIAVLGLVTLGPSFGADDTLERAREMERRGDAAAAKLLLQRRAEANPDTPSVLADYAEFLDYYNDPGTRPAYERLLAASRRASDAARTRAAVRRLVLLDLLAGNNESAARRLEEYRAAGGTGWSLAAASDLPPAGADVQTIDIPGPYTSFARMAALSPDVAPENVLTAMARNVVTTGYQAGGGAEGLEPTEYMKLLLRYLSQARELEKLAGAGRTLQVPACESEQTGELLRILGYRMRGGCGSEVVLETVNATRAFLTIDSGFPLAELEQALRTNRPFTYDYSPTRVPVLYGTEYWMGGKEKRAGEFIGNFLGDPSICRLYLGLAKLDPETAGEIRKAVPAQRIRAVGHVLDFFGGMFEIRGGKAVVPGGARAARAWEDLAGVSPDRGAAFFERLISRDDGWMASYFDALARIEGPVLQYLTEPERLKRFYMAVRGRVTSPGPARPVFRSNTDMMLLATRLRLEGDGRPHIPGNLEVWKNLFIKHPHGKYDGKLTRLATTWKEPDDVIEALFALCRKTVENEPLKIFLALSDLNRRRAKPLEPATVDALARQYRVYGDQYPILGESPSLSDKTILQFLDTAGALSRLRDMQLRANAVGTMQALVGLWQIYCRQGSIAESDADGALAAILSGFSRIRGAEELFDAGSAGVNVLLKATHAREGARPQEWLVDLLAGSARPSDPEAHAQMVQEVARIFDAQRLLSLNTIFELADHLDGLARGEKLNPPLLARLSSRVADLQTLRSGLTSVERNAFTFGYWSERHVDMQRKVNLRVSVERAGRDPERLRELRGQLTPFLRDTLVGLNYAHCAPPGSQILYTNPLFVRSHDFLGLQTSVQTWRTTEVYGSGWPANAGGRLVGSLAGLPYALAEAEQNFLIPEREQALIWGDLVPQMILSAKVPRWWDVTPAQMHWVSLHMRYAESLLAEAAVDPQRREAVTAVLERRVAPARAQEVKRLVGSGRVRAAVDALAPSELYALAQESLGDQGAEDGGITAEIRRLRSESPDRINYQAISRVFGTPKPVLTNSYRPELLHLRTFPTLMGYSSRIMAESWESSTLYWAALADEIHLPPGRLNILIPEWTQKTVERIFATHLEDWPALLRSMRQVGDDVRSRARSQEAGEQKASLH